MDPIIVTFVSVITTGLVSILSIFIPVILESRKAKQTRIFAATEKLETTTLDLLRELSYFRHPAWGDIEKSAHRPVQQALSDLQVRHYAWERAIWFKLDENQQQQVETLRKKFEALSTQSISKLALEEIPGISGEILALTRVASSRL